MPGATSEGPALAVGDVAAGSGEAADALAEVSASIDRATNRLLVRMVGLLASQDGSRQGASTCVRSGRGARTRPSRPAIPEAGPVRLEVRAIGRERIDPLIDHDREP